MFEPITVAEDSERGLLLGVPPAPGDPYAALSLYALDPVHGPGRVAELQRRTSRLDADVEVGCTRGVLTLTASFLPAGAPAVLAAIREGLVAEVPPGPPPPPPPEDPLRAALFDAAPIVSATGPLVVALTASEEVPEAAAALLEAWPGRGWARTVTPTVPRRAPGPIARDASGAAHTRWRLACPAPARDDPRYRATALAALHLSAVDGPLSTRLRRDLAAAYTVATRVHPELGQGWLSVDAVLSPDRAPDAASVIREELRRLREDPPSEERVVALRSRLLARIARSLADNRGRCSDATSGSLYGLAIDHHRHIEDGVSALERSDLVRAVAALEVERMVGFETAVRARTP